MADMYSKERSKRYDIPLANLDYTYIANCTNVKEVEQIVKLLRSGDEGAFPELTKFAEDHLEKLNPKSRVLRKSEPVKTSRDLDKEELHDLQGDLASWTNEMQSLETQLGSTKIAADRGDSLPPVRGKNADPNTGGDSAEATKKSARRVKPRDYREWDKVDIDAELAKIDNKEEPKPSATKAPGKPAPISSKIDTSDLNDQEKQLKAEREKDKGNEAFRAGDYEEAVLYYSRSLSITYTVAATNNRAQCHVKLKQWDKALKDCNAVLQKDNNNLKALLRRGVAHQGKKEYVNAKNDLKQVLDKEPNNRRAKEVLDEVEKALDEQKVKGRRMLIEETDGSSSESDEYEDARDTTADTAPHMTNGFAKSHSGEDSDTDVKAHRADTSKSCMTNTKGSADGKVNVTGDKTIPTQSDDTVKQEATSPPTTDSKSSLPQAADSKVHKPSLPTAAASEVPAAAPTPPSPTAAPTPPAPTAAPTPPAPVVTPQLPLPSAVMKWKEEGMTHFKAGQYGEAVEVYTKAINKLLPDTKGHSANLSVLYSNRAASHMKVGHCSACVKDCDAALELNPGALKPLMRRAQALESMERYRNAYIDYRHALHVGGPNDVVHQGLTRCQNMLQSQDGVRWREKLPPMPVLGISPALSRPVSSSSQNPSTPAGSSSNHSTTPVKGVSPEEEFEMMKERGNNHVKEGQFTEAAECYACCIKHFPDRPVPYTNRALCYLRLNKPDLVIEDCDKAVSLQSDNIKALFRRAQAYKMQKCYGKSISDLEAVIRMDKKNTAAARELKVVQKYKEEEDKKASEGKKRQRLKIQEVEDFSEESSSEEESVSSTDTGTKKSPKSAAENGSGQAKTAPISPNKKSPKPNKESPTKTPKSSSKGHQSSPSKSANVNSQSNTPSKPVSQTKAAGSVKTPFEFLHAWSSLKPSQGTSAYTELLDKIEPQDLPKVLSNKLDGAMLSMLICCMHNLIASGQASRALSYLQNLTQVPRFQMVTMFMSDKEKQDLNLVLKELEEQANCDILLKDLDKLRKQYSL